MMSASIDISNAWRQWPLTIVLGDSRTWQCAWMTYGQLWRKFLWRWKMQPFSYEHIDFTWALRQLQCWHSKWKARWRRSSSQWQRLFRLLPVTTARRSIELQVCVFFVNYQSRSQGQASQKGNRSITIDLTTHVKQGFRHTPDDLYITFRQFALYNHLSHMFCSVCSMTHPGFVFTKTTNVHSTHTGITRSCIAAVLFFRTRHRFFYFLSKHEWSSISWRLCLTNRCRSPQALLFLIPYCLHASHQQCYSRCAN